MSTATPAYEFVLTEPYTFTDYRYESADAWDKVTLTPGTYPVIMTAISYRPIREGERPYYATIQIPATKTESYYVNKLGSASLVRHEKELHIKFNYHAAPYAYQMKDGYTLLGGVIREVR